MDKEKVSLEDFCRSFNIETKNFVNKDKAGMYQQWAQRQYRRFLRHLEKESKRSFSLQSFSMYLPEVENREPFVLWKQRVRQKYFSKKN